MLSVNTQENRRIAQLSLSPIRRVVEGRVQYKINHKTGRVLLNVPPSRNPYGLQIYSQLSAETWRFIDEVVGEVNRQPRPGLDSVRQMIPKAADRSVLVRLPLPRAALWGDHDKESQRYLVHDALLGVGQDVRSPIDLTGQPLF